MPLRRLERWLHQHLFKVGWLATKNLRTTTILYYTFFLPGVALNQFFYWLVAGVFDVRAERAITWPAEQAVGELRLDFIRLARNAGRVRIAFISLAPLLAGLAAIWVISNHVLDVQPVLTVIAAGQWGALPAALARLAATPDFYLWVYIAFTISNTMMPRFADLKPLRIAGYVIVGAVAAALLFHVADEPILKALSGPVSAGLRALAGAFIVMIGIDLLAVAALGTVEALIERITGDSATFVNGKMVTMRREELQRLREQEQTKRERERARRASTPSGPPSIYKVALPLPDLPGREASEPITVRRDERSGLPAPTPAAPAGATPALPAASSLPTFTSAPGSAGGQTPSHPPASPLRPTASTPGSPTPAASPLRPGQPSAPGTMPSRPPTAPHSGTPESGRSPSTPTPKPSTGGHPSSPSPLRPSGAPSASSPSPARPFGGSPVTPIPGHRPALDDEDDEPDDSAKPAEPRGSVRPAWMSRPATPTTPSGPFAAQTDDEDDDEAPAQPRGTVRPTPKPAQPLSGRSLTDFMSKGIYDDDAEEDEDKSGKKPDDDDGVTYEPAEEIP